jgi:hypothetical protein
MRRRIAFGHLSERLCGRAPHRVALAISGEAREVDAPEQPQPKQVGTNLPPFVPGIRRQERRRFWHVFGNFGLGLRRNPPFPGVAADDLQVRWDASHKSPSSLRPVAVLTVARRRFFPKLPGIAAANVRGRARPQFWGAKFFLALPPGNPCLASPWAPPLVGQTRLLLSPTWMNSNARSVQLMAQASQVLASARTTSSKRARCLLQRHTDFIAKW